MFPENIFQDQCFQDSKCFPRSVKTVNAVWVLSFSLFISFTRNIDFPNKHAQNCKSVQSARANLSYKYVWIPNLPTLENMERHWLETMFLITMFLGLSGAEFKSTLGGLKLCLICLTNKTMHNQHFHLTMHSQHDIVEKYLAIFLFHARFRELFHGIYL